MKRLSLLLTAALCPLLLAASAGCADDDSSGEEGGLEVLQAAEPLRQDCGLSTAERLVITSQEAWVDTWRKLNSRRGTPLELPPIDFTERTVLVASMGEQNSSSVSISLDDFVRRGSSAEVTVTESTPAAGCSSLPTISHPVAVVTVPRVETPVDFIEKKAESPCR